MSDQTTETSASDDAAVPAWKKHFDRMVALEKIMREETKETLVLYVASTIVWHTQTWLGLEGADLEAAIEKEIEHVRKWRDMALSNNRTRRFDRFVERIKAGDFPKPRRKRRRRPSKKI